MKQFFMMCLVALLLLTPAASFADMVTDPLEGALNDFTIISTDEEGTPFTGFVYELISGEGQSLTIDLTEVFEFKTKLKDGSYTLKEISRPADYEEAPEVSFELPYAHGDIVARNIEVYPKHLKSEPVPTPVEPEPEVETPVEPEPEEPAPPTEDKPLVPTGVQAASALFAASAVFFGVGMLTIKRKKY